MLEQLESLSQLRKQAKEWLVDRARVPADYQTLVKWPVFGPVRVAQLIAEVATPHRFRAKRQFRPHCGYAAVTRSSKVSTCELNRNHNPQLKQVFKGRHLPGAAVPGRER